MKQKTTAILGVLSVLLLLSATAVYAHGAREETTVDSGVTSIEEMDEMHELMTESLEPELKEQMDLIHEGCMSEHEDGSTETMMGNTMMAGMM